MGYTSPSGPDLGEGPLPDIESLALCQHSFFGPYNSRIAFVAIAAIPTPDVGPLAVYAAVPYAGLGSRSDSLCRPHRCLVGIVVP
jgi:hypothetical protein